MEGWREREITRDYNMLSVAQGSLVELSKKGKVQVLKPDSQADVPF